MQPNILAHSANFDTDDDIGMDLMAKANKHKTMSLMPARRPTNGSAHGAEPNSSLVIRNVTVNGKRTSVRLEPEMWHALNEICRRERCSMHDVCSLVAASKNAPGSLTAMIRVFIMAYFRAAATEDGHNRAGHGSGAVLQPLFAKMASKTERRVGY